MYEDVSISFCHHFALMSSFVLWDTYPIVISMQYFARCLYVAAILWFLENWFFLSVYCRWPAGCYNLQRSWWPKKEESWIYIPRLWLSQNGGRCKETTWNVPRVWLRHHCGLGGPAGGTRRGDHVKGMLFHLTLAAGDRRKSCGKTGVVEGRQFEPVRE